MPAGYIKGQPDVGYWLKEIRLGLEFRKKSAFEQKWDRWRQYYRGEWKAGILPSAVFFRMVRSTVPRIYFRNPSISVTPAQPGVENAILAKLLERTDNKLIRAMKLKKQMKRMVQDAWMFGTAVGKKGFGSQYQATPEPFGQTAIRNENRKGTLPNYVEYNFDIQANMPWFLRAAPSGFVLPSGTENFEDARWYAFIIHRAVDDVKDDSRFKNVSEVGATSITEEVGGKQSRFKKDLDETVLYEIRDKKTGMVFVISGNGGGKVHLFEPDEFLRLRINAPSLLVFNEDDERVWGIPDAQHLEPLQMEMNEIKTYMMYHRRLSIIRILAKKNAIVEEEAAKLVGPDVAPIVWTNENVDAAIKFVESADIPQGLRDMELEVLAEIRETMGFSRNEAGEFKEGSRSPTATETRVVKQASDLRVDERRDMVSDLLVDTVMDMHPIIFNHWTQEQVVEIVGPGGIPFWIQFRPQMLSKTAYNVKADPDQMIPETREVRENKALVLYERLKMNPLIDPFKLTSFLLRELHGVAFDDMMRGFPEGLGMTPGQPMNIGQFQQTLGNIARTAPQLFAGPNTVSPRLLEQRSAPAGG
jgi:hypothetical protein